MKVLVVDASRVMRQIVVRTLRQAGFDGVDVVEAVDGREGLALVSAERPDLILSDWIIPHLSGIDLLATLRTMGDVTPFGFVTSHSSTQVRERAARGGALFLIAKPFTPEAFSDALTPILA